MIKNGLVSVDFLSCIGVLNFLNTETLVYTSEGEIVNEKGYVINNLASDGISFTLSSPNNASTIKPIGEEVYRSKENYAIFERKILCSLYVNRYDYRDEILEENDKVLEEEIVETQTSYSFIDNQDRVRVLDPIAIDFTYQLENN